ncbi:tetrapyrrole methylase [Scenedesmus sp. NREL 46B-D3]|nr:tetrapyrrole methylase [Scenedesmus sp. NREL 46B-D3]
MFCHLTTRAMRSGSSSGSSTTRSHSCSRSAVGKAPPACHSRCTTARLQAAEAAGAGVSGAPFVFHNPASAEESALPPGKCWLAGVGPGSWDHVTMKVAKLIAEAEVLVYDDLGAQQAEIDKLLVALCQQGKRVVRLKGGCPSTFSRVGSEASALSAAGCVFELVPGVSTATAAAVLAGLPLTDAKLAGAYAVLSAHDAGCMDWAAVKAVPTLVILMGGRALALIVQQLQATGWPDDTPVAVVKEAGTAAQTAWFSTLASVEQDTQPGAPLSPCIIVVGRVAGLPAAWAGTNA